MIKKSVIEMKMIWSNSCSVVLAELVITKCYPFRAEIIPE